MQPPIVAANDRCFSCLQASSAIQNVRQKLQATSESFARLRTKATTSRAKLAIIAAETISFNPPNGNFAFELRRPHEAPPAAVNGSRTSHILLAPSGVDGCAAVDDDAQRIVVREAGAAYTLPLSSSGGDLAHCAVSVRLANERVRLDRPFVDAFVVVRNDAWWSRAFDGGGPSAASQRRRRRLCVAVHLTSSAGASVSGSCVLSEGDGRPSGGFASTNSSVSQCLVRLNVPFPMFEIDAARSSPSEPVSVGVQTIKHTQAAERLQHLNASYFVTRHQCGSRNSHIAERELPGGGVRLISSVDQLRLLSSAAQAEGQLSLLARANFSLSPNAMGAVIVHFKPSAAYATSRAAAKLGAIRLWLRVDEQFEIISASPLEARWHMRVESGDDNQIVFTLTPSNTTQE